METSTTFKVYNASAGSGKTFTLVKEYLKILFIEEGIYTFQSILAITFTNKAAAEMKERILENLLAFEHDSSNSMLQLISAETKIEIPILQAKSKKIVEAILQNYAAFNITTIDSFTHKIIRSFAYDLGLSMNFEVEMDGVRLLEEAVDVVLSKIGLDTALTEVLIDFSIEKLNDDKSWDISKDLSKIARLLLNEEDVLQLKKIESKSLEDFKQLKKNLSKERRIIEKEFKNFGLKGMQIIEDAGLQPNHFPYSDLPNFFKKLIDFKNKLLGEFSFENRLSKSMRDGVLYTKSQKKDIKEIIDSIYEPLSQLYNTIEAYYTKEYSNYALAVLVTKSLTPISLINHIQKEVNTIKNQNNICLNGEFNQLISEKIKNEPAPFIYERIGEKFKYYFIDEMQDTSALQWQNLIPLIGNALSQEKAGLLLVGDAKQAIYRWRGGKAEQFINLAEAENKPENNPFYIEKEASNLAVNFRSFSEIIQFNNQFFTFVAPFLSNNQYKNLYEIGNQQQVNAKTGGYVQIDFIDKKDLEKEEKEQAFAQKTYQIITELDTSFAKSDVCILVRSKKEGITIANYLSERAIKILSSETLLLQNSDKVQFIVNLLQAIQNPMDLDAKFQLLVFYYNYFNIKTSKHEFYAHYLISDTAVFFESLKTLGTHFSIERFLESPFYESIEEIIRAFQLLPTSDAYVQFFLDFVLDFQRKNTHNLASFLEVWHQKKDKLTITSAEGADAVTIMTIHKSKGLEFPVVIFPCELDIFYEIEPVTWYESLPKEKYNNFNSSLISCSSSLAFTGEEGKQLFHERKESLALDNYNLLYVALTRAVEQLYVITELKSKSEIKEYKQDYSSMYLQFLQSLPDENGWNETKTTYVFGEKTRVLPIKKQESLTETKEQDGLISTPWESHQIEIVSNSSKSWNESETAKNYGLLIHEMLSKVIVANDVYKVVLSYVSGGIIHEKEGGEIVKILEKVVFHEQLKDCFLPNLKVYTEKTMVTAKGSFLIPDRLVFFPNNKVIIIDYKTGNPSEEHKLQIATYANLLVEMGYQIFDKRIVYISNLIEVSFIQ